MYSLSLYAVFALVDFEGVCRIRVSLKVTLSYYIIIFIFFKYLADVVGAGGVHQLVAQLFGAVEVANVDFEEAFEGFVGAAEGWLVVVEEVEVVI